jgi:hypothetical protein
MQRLDLGQIALVIRGVVLCVYISPRDGVYWLWL